MKKKWTEALQLASLPNSKSNFVCIDNFDCNTIKCYGNAGSRKRLSPDDIPNLDMKKSTTSDINEFYINELRLDVPNVKKLMNSDCSPNGRM